MKLLTKRRGNLLLCFVLLWKSGFLAIKIAATLSQCISMRVTLDMWSSCRKFLTHNILQVVRTILSIMLLHWNEQQQSSFYSSKRPRNSTKKGPKTKCVLPICMTSAKFRRNKANNITLSIFLIMQAFSRRFLRYYRKCPTMWHCHGLSR